MAKAAQGFRVPPEVPRYFADRDLKPHFSWLDVWAEEHARAFTVAKAVELDLLKAFHEGLKQAIDKGQTFETWRDELKPNLEKLGWWGRRQVSDPTGQDKPRTVDFSAPRRLQTIFWSNMRSARAAGQWDRAQRTKRALPYLLYVRTTSKDPRREHLSWAGIILPIDHSFWRTHFPPNGWLCKCAVRQISASERDRYGARDGYSLEPPTIDMKPFINRRTGEVTYVPVGIDPGWHTNPGAVANRGRQSTATLTDAVAALVKPAPAAAPATPQAVPDLVAMAAAAIPRAARAAAQAAVREIVHGPGFADLHARAAAINAARRSAMAAARLAGGGQAEIDAAASKHPWKHLPIPVAVLPERLDALRGDAPLTITVTDHGMGHSALRPPASLPDWLLLQSTLDTGEIYVSDDNDRLWSFSQRDGTWWVTVLVRQSSSWRVMTYFRSDAKYVARQKASSGRRQFDRV